MALQIFYFSDLLKLFKSYLTVSQIKATLLFYMHLHELPPKKGKTQ